MLRFVLEPSGGYLKSIRARLVKILSSVMEALTSSAQPSTSTGLLTVEPRTLHYSRSYYSYDLISDHLCNCSCSCTGREMKSKWARPAVPANWKSRDTIARRHWDQIWKNIDITSFAAQDLVRARCYAQRARISQHPKHSFALKSWRHISTPILSLMQKYATNLL